MRASEYPRMFDLESHHWWYLGMEAITRAFLNRYLTASQDRRLLDAGCGTGGAMANYLPEYGSVTGFDISPLALALCRQRHLVRLVRASAAEAPFAPSTFDVVTCFDVLYLMERAAGVLEEFARILRPGGHLLLRVAAYDWLRGEHDNAVQTVHRYTLQEAVQLLTAAGFDVIHASYINTLLFPLAVVKRVWDGIWPPLPDRSDLTATPKALNGLLRLVLAGEARVASRLRLPMGLSLCALARRPEHDGHSR